MKRILALTLLLAVYTSAKADNFAGNVAFNPTGYTLTQTTGMVGDDMAAFWFVAPDVVGRYTITVDRAPDSPLVAKYALITDSTFDIDLAYAYRPTFHVSVGPNATDDLHPGEYYFLYVHNITPRGRDTCKARQVCNVTVTIHPAR